jgi:hypothetical protein
MKPAAMLTVVALSLMALSLTFALPSAPSQAQRESLLYARPVPLSSLSLTGLERWQVAAHRHYLGAYRVHERVAARRALSRTEWTHRRWYRLASLWTARELRETRERIRLQRLQTMGPREAICYVFGGYCQQALAVARCESNLYVYARSPGGHLGIFQFGSYARSTYGFGWTALEQARAAYRMFRAEGWAPWECASIVGIR